jgi:hypothetical protein
MLVDMLLFGLSIAIAPILVVFYRESRLFWVMAILATGFLFNGGAANVRPFFNAKCALLRWQWWRIFPSRQVSLLRSPWPHMATDTGPWWV